MNNAPTTACQELLGEPELEALDVVANCCMNRERELYGTNGYMRELGLDPVAFLCARTGPSHWLDLCCGTGRALVEALEKCEGLGRNNVEITGVDLVRRFVGSHPRLRRIVAPIRLVERMPKCDLLTIVHGLHYVGDKLGTIERVAHWLHDDGQLVAQLDLNHVLVDGRRRRPLIIERLRSAGFDWDGRRHRLRIQGPPRLGLNLHFLGAHPGGANYTGQPAVCSHYSMPKA